MLFIWKWEVFSTPRDGSEKEDSSIEEFSEEETEQVCADSRHDSTHVVTFKCIGSTKSQNYQKALRKARDLLLGGQIVPVSIVHEPMNPRDSNALAFVCTIEGKKHTIGYVVSELLDEVHTAYRAGNIVSVKISWVRYITDWTRSGPGFFAGVDIEKKGRWSSNAIAHSKYSLTY